MLRVVYRAVQLPDGCFDALTTVLCGLVPEAYAAGVDLYGVMCAPAPV